MPFALARPARLIALAACIACASAPAVAAPDLRERAIELRDKASEVVFNAMNFLGVPYRRGGQSDEGFDCSGFTRHLFESTFGLLLPRRADEQAHSPELEKIDRQELKPGDLVFFNTLKRTFSHVGIYVGEGRFIHAPRPGGSVRIEEMSLPYWNARFTGARRVVGLGDAPAVMLAATGPVVGKALSAAWNAMPEAAAATLPPTSPTPAPAATLPEAPATLVAAAPEAATLAALPAPETAARSITPDERTTGTKPSARRTTKKAAAKSTAKAQPAKQAKGQPAKKAGTARRTG